MDTNMFCKWDSIKQYGTLGYVRWVFGRLVERLNPRVLHVNPTHSHKHQALSWMAQELSKRLGSVGYNPSISHL